MWLELFQHIDISKTKIAIKQKAVHVGVFAGCSLTLICVLEYDLVTENNETVLGNIFSGLASCFIESEIFPN